MRWVLSRRVPPVTRLLLVESGPRSIAEKVLPRFREVFGKDVPVDLLTCLATDPANHAVAERGSTGAVWRVTDYANDSARWRLLKEIRARRHPVTAIICSGDPIMGRWKAAVLLLLPSKFLIVNEYADFFWVDRGNWRSLSRLILYRAGLREDSAVRTLAQICVFPFSLVYLLGYAGVVHVIRLSRMALGLNRR